MTEPVTEKRTVIAGVAFPYWSLTVAVTQCCESTTFVAVFGDKVSVAGGPGVQVLAAVSLGSPTSMTPFLFASAKAMIASKPATVPV